jgi:hypothetical protein
MRLFSLPTKPETPDVSAGLPEGRFHLNGVVV